jgi:hypothetical protein
MVTVPLLFISSDEFYSLCSSVISEGKSTAGSVFNTSIFFQRADPSFDTMFLGEDSLEINNLF